LRSLLFVLAIFEEEEEEEEEEEALFDCYAHHLVMRH
tara:strand:- start:187 stop:297 length:111 start_codon:yes stop_codon:yes gene_type:complete